MYYSKWFNPLLWPFTSSWKVLDNNMSSFFCVFNRQKGSHSGAVRSLLPAFTYLRWYTGLPVVHLLKQNSRRVYPVTVTIINILNYYLYANQSAGSVLFNISVRLASVQYLVLMGFIYIILKNYLTNLALKCQSTSILSSFGRFLTWLFLYG